MDEAGITQKDLAGRLRVGQSTISNWLKGELPQARNRLALAQFFGVAYGRLYAGEGNPNALNITCESAIEPIPTREMISRYFAAFLDACDTPAKLGWTWIELCEYFPLDKWARTSRGRRATEQPVPRESEPQGQGEPLAETPVTFAALGCRKLDLEPESGSISPSKPEHREGVSE